MRTVRVLRCTVCGTLWREPLPSRQPAASTSTDAQKGPEAGAAEPPAVTLVPVADRRHPADRRRSGFGGRREGDVKRPVADPRQWRGERRKKSEG